MTWFWIWFVLALGALVFLGLLGLRVFRKGMAVLRELGRVNASMGEATAAREADYDEWLVTRAQEDAADAERRQQERDGSPPRRHRSPAALAKPYTRQRVVR